MLIVLAVAARAGSRFVPLERLLLSPWRPVTRQRQIPPPAAGPRQNPLGAAPPGTSSSAAQLNTGPELTGQKQLPTWAGWGRILPRNPPLEHGPQEHPQPHKDTATALPALPPAREDVLGGQNQLSPHVPGAPAAAGREASARQGSQHKWPQKAVVCAASSTEPPAHRGAAAPRPPLVLQCGVLGAASRAQLVLSLRYPHTTPRKCSVLGRRKLFYI